MDPSLYPSPPYECLTDITSAACGQAMFPLCTDGSLYDGETIASLINPSSNCAAWRSAILLENALVGTLSLGSSYLDQAGAAYCATQPNATECECINFPTNPASAPWCGHSSGSSDCPTGPGLCSLDQIAQSRGDGVVDVLEFPSCVPHFCWLSSCYDSNGLVPTTMILSQTLAGTCPPWCLQIDSNNTYDGSISPGAPGSWHVQGGDVITQCGNGSVGPSPFIAENTYLFSNNSEMTVPLLVTNQGDVPLELSVTGVFPSWADLNPKTISIPGRTMAQIILAMSQPFLKQAQQAAPNGHLVTQTVLTFSYPAAEGVTETYTSTQTIDVGAAQPPQVETRSVTPSWFFAACAVFGVLLVGILLAAAKDRSFVLQFMRQHKIQAK